MSEGETVGKEKDEQKYTDGVADLVERTGDVLESTERATGAVRNHKSKALGLHQQAEDPKVAKNTQDIHKALGSGKTIVDQLKEESRLSELPELKDSASRNNG